MNWLKKLLATISLFKAVNFDPGSRHRSIGFEKSSFLLLNLVGSGPPGRVHLGVDPMDVTLVP